MFLLTDTLLVHITVESFSQDGNVIIPSTVITFPGRQEQPQSSYPHQRNRRDPPTEISFWQVVVSFKESFKLFLEYLRVKLNVGVANHELGSLLITVTCSSLQILEGLWKDYSSGHLNKVAEERLVTAQVLEKLGLDGVKLKTTITKDDYRKCKKFFWDREQVRLLNLYLYLQNFQS